MNPRVDQQAPRRKVLVVGIGNPDRGDDGLGALVVRRLAGRLPADVALMARAGDMLALIDDWAGCDAAICIDAAAPTGAPGRIRRLDLASDELPPNLSATSSHAFGLADAVGLARTLGCAPRDIVIYAVEGCCFTGGAAMTQAVAAAADEVGRQVTAEADRLLRGGMQIVATEAMLHA